MQNLNKQNFWIAIETRYPNAYYKFCKWIDGYKQEVKWDTLFGNSLKENMDVPATKFHGLPIEMQAGILVRFEVEVMGVETWEPPRMLHNAMESTENLFRQLNQLTEKQL